MYRIIFAVLVLASSQAFAAAQQATGLRPARITVNPAVLTLARPVPPASADPGTQVQALAEQVAALQAENAKLWAKLEKLEAKVDGNQWTQVAATTNLKQAQEDQAQAYAAHTHTYEVKSYKTNNVKIDGEWATFISGTYDVERTSSPPNP